MFAIPGICALLMFILARPQEYFQVLQRVPLLYIFCAAAVGGFVVDLRLRRLQPVAVPTLKWVLLFLGWATVCNIVEQPQNVISRTIELAILFVLFATIAHGVQRFRSLEVVAGTMMATCLFLTTVCLHQGLQERSCVAIDPSNPGEGNPDGRPCELATTCIAGDSEPGADYVCEKVGLFATYTVEDRVRYRGELHDPNELSLTICVGGAAFLIAFAVHRKRGPALVGALVGVPLVFWCVLETQSRGGLVVFLIVAAVYFVKRYGIGGLIAGGVIGLPVLMLGSRSGESADESTMLRYEAWDAGLRMFKASPIFGVGHRAFGDHHFMAAHNSYVLTVAELGLPGQFLFISIIYLNVKMLITGVRALDNVPGAAIARSWGLALLASFCGLIFQINTLSFAYHSVLWIFFGFGGAWWSAVRGHKPDFEVRLTARDLAILAVGCVSFDLVLLPLFLRYKGA